MPDPLQEHAARQKLPDVTGVLLAGGQSRRMGRDKATLEIDGVPLFARVDAFLQGLFPCSFIAGDRPDLARPDLPSYPDIYPGSALGGLFTGLTKAQTPWIFVVPCDMPFPDARIAGALLDARENFHTVVPRTAKGVEPLFALYHKNCLQPMREMLEAGNYRILDLYRRVETCYLNLEGLPWVERSFVNLNTINDLDHLREAPS